MHRCIISCNWPQYIYGNGYFVFVRATGYKMYGTQYKDQLSEVIRRAAELCDCLQCFFVLHSMGGGKFSSHSFTCYIIAIVYYLWTMLFMPALLHLEVSAIENKMHAHFVQHISDSVLKKKVTDTFPRLVGYCMCGVSPIILLTSDHSMADVINIMQAFTFKNISSYPF